jgi:hypothetical protein
MYSKLVTFRNSKIIYYGPHACENCGATIAKMGSEWGGTAFTYPDGPIYPNTEWHPHVCDQALVAEHSIKKGLPHVHTEEIRRPNRRRL